MGSARSTQWERSHHTSLADYVTAIAPSPQGEYLAASSSIGEVMLWQHPAEQGLLSPTPLLEPTDQGAISALAVSASGDWLAASGQNGRVLVWKGRSPHPDFVTIPNHGSAWIDQLAWNPAHDQLAFGTERTVQVWDAASDKMIASLNFESSSVLGLAWHPDGTHLAACGQGGVKVWNSHTWAPEPYILQVPGASISIAWSPQGRYLASGNLDRTLSVLEWGQPPPWLMQGFPGKVRRVAWLPTAAQNSPQLAAACTEGITIWHRADSENTWKSRVLTGHRGTVQAIAFHPTDPLLASAANDGCICLWHQAKKRLQSLKEPAGVSCLSWHPHGRFLAAGGQQGDLTLWVPSQRGQGFQRR